MKADFDKNPEFQKTDIALRKMALGRLERLVDMGQRTEAEVSLMLDPVVKRVGELLGKEPQTVEPALPEQTQPTPEQTPTEGAVEPQPTPEVTPEVPAEPVNPETERTNKFGVPRSRKKQKGKHSYTIEYEGDTVDIDIETPHGGTTRDVTIKRPGYAPKQVTIEARS